MIDWLSLKARKIFDFWQNAREIHVHAIWLPFNIIADTLHLVLSSVLTAQAR